MKDEALGVDYGAVPEPLSGGQERPEPSATSTEPQLTEKTEPVEDFDRGDVKPVPTVQQRRFSVDWDPIQ